MKIRSQIGMVLNLDKCIGCHTCSITCKNVWTSREGMEYAWFNNVESKPGTGYPSNWENQKQWKGGWERTSNGDIQPRIGGKRPKRDWNPALRQQRFRLPRTEPQCDEAGPDEVEHEDCPPAGDAGYQLAECRRNHRHQDEDGIDK